jgi:hypothetical protein
MMQRIGSADLRSFAFLDDHQVILGLLGHPALKSDPTLMVVDFVESTSGAMSLEEVPYKCALFLPPLLSSVECSEICIRCDPVIPPYTVSSDSPLPFSADPNGRLFVVSFRIQDDTEAHGYTLFVPLSTILLHTASLGPLVCRGVEWEGWGPNGTRMIPRPHLQSQVWVCYVHGMRYAVANRKPRPRGSVDLYDFRRYTHRPTGLGPCDPDFGALCIHVTCSYCANPENRRACGENCAHHDLRNAHV